METGRKLRISHLHWGFPPIIGGVETHLTIILPMMVELGHEVSLLTCSAPGISDRETWNGVEIRRSPLMDLNDLFKRGLEGIDADVERMFSDFIEEMKPDVLHAHNMHYFSKVHAQTLQRIAEQKGIPLFLTAHNTWDDDLFLELTVNIGWTHIIAVSYFVEKELRSVGWNHRKVTTIHHGIDEQKFRPDVDPEPIYRKYPQLRGRKVFFHPARMRLTKGCDVSIKALRLVKEKVPDAMLVLAGTKNNVDWGNEQDRDIPYMFALVERFGLEKDVLIDSYSLDEMPYLYAASRVSVYPSTLSEPFGLTMLESMATGVPMIVTDAGGMPEVIRNGINGFVVPIRGYEELAAHVTHLLEDEDLRDRFATVCRFQVEKNYTRRIVTENTVELYRRILGA